MKLFSLFFSLAGGILAFFSFTLPWVDQVSGVKSVQYGAASHASFVIVLSLVLVVFGIYMLNRKSGIKGPLISLSLIIIFIGGIFFVASLLSLINTGVNVVAISFIACIIVLCAILFMFNHRSSFIPLLRNLVFIGCCVGLCCFYVLLYATKYAIVVKYFDVGVIKYGAFLNVIGYVIVMVGQFLYPKPD